MNTLGRTLNVNVNYSVLFLIEQLKNNKNSHITDYNKAVEVWQQDHDKLLKKLIKASRKSLGVYENEESEITKCYCDFSNLVKPVNACKTYDTYISLLEQTTSDHVLLSIQDANAIINDEWDWAVAAKITNALYSSRY